MLLQVPGQQLHPDQGSREHAMSNIKAITTYILCKVMKETTRTLQLRNATYLATGYGIV